MGHVGTFPACKVSLHQLARAKFSTNFTLQLQKHGPHAYHSFTSAIMSSLHPVLKMHT